MQEQSILSAALFNIESKLTFRDLHLNSSRAVFPEPLYLLQRISFWRNRKPKQISVYLNGQFFFRAYKKRQSESKYKFLNPFLWDREDCFSTFVSSSSNIESNSRELESRVEPISGLFVDLEADFQLKGFS